MRRLTTFIIDELKNEREYKDQLKLKEEADEFFNGTSVDPIYSWSYIDENLQSHDYKKLIKAIEKEFDVQDIACYDTDDKTNNIYVLFKNDIHKHDEKLKSILDFFNYFYRNKVDNRRSNLYGYVCIEPKYSEKISKEELETYHKIFYHYTTKDRANTIMKTGLRIKSSKEYNYPSRIYLVACKKYDVSSDNMLHFAKQQIGSQKVYKEHGLACIQVNLNEPSIDVYKDSALPEDKAYFVYNNIPPKYLKEIEL